MNPKSRLITIGILFVVKFLFGFWLSRSGKPYSVIVLTVHKLISLAILFLIANAVYRLRADVSWSGAEVTAIVITGMLFLVAIGTGGVLSMEKPAPAIIALIHKITPYLTIVSSAVTLYLFVRGKA